MTQIVISFYVKLALVHAAKNVSLRKRDHDGNYETGIHQHTQRQKNRDYLLMAVVVYADCRIIPTCLSQGCDCGCDYN